MTPEGQVKKECRALLDTLGYRFSPVQTGYGKRTLDDLCCIKGRFVTIEYKRPGEKPRTFQKLIGEEVQRAGGIYIYAISLEQMKHYLRGYGLFND